MSSIFMGPHIRCPWTSFVKIINVVGAVNNMLTECWNSLATTVSSPPPWRPYHDTVLQDWAPARCPGSGVLGAAPQGLL